MQRPVRHGSDVGGGAVAAGMRGLQRGGRIAPRVGVKHGNFQQDGAASGPLRVKVRGGRPHGRQPCGGRRRRAGRGNVAASQRADPEDRGGAVDCYVGPVRERAPCARLGQGYAGRRAVDRRRYGPAVQGERVRGGVFKVARGVAAAHLV